jgi:hypothetical protein
MHHIGIVVKFELGFWLIPFRFFYLFFPKRAKNWRYVDLKSTKNVPWSMM